LEGLSVTRKQELLLHKKQDELAHSEEYSGSEPLTDFSSVGKATDLSRLNFNWTERDLPERARTKHVHRLHPYLGKFVPQLVEIFLRKFRPSTVYDPFLGSGTTLVEANVLGIAGVGTDVSIFNCLLSRVKTTRYDMEKVRRAVLGALSQVEARAEQSGDQKSLFPITANDFPRGASNAVGDYLRSWYSPKALQDLLNYRAVIDDHDYPDLLRIVLSRAARSSRLTKHFDLEFPKRPQTEPYDCHKHRRICHPTVDSLGFLRRYSLDALRRIEEFAAIRTNARVSVLHEDARRVRLPKVDLLITSPPYLGLIDYHEQHRYAYELLGLDRRDDAEIGAASKGRSRSAREDYLRQIAEVFENARRQMKRGATAVVIVADSEGFYTDMAAKVGFREEGRLRRHVNRRTGRRSSDFFEEVLIWRCA
jgi:hypothetical protein